MLWRQAHEKYDVSFLVPKVAHSPGVMLWDCFTHERVGPLWALADSWNEEEEVNNAEALAGDSQNEDELSPIKTEVDNDIASVPDESIIIIIYYRTFTRNNT